MDQLNIKSNLVKVLILILALSLYLSSCNLFDSNSGADESEERECPIRIGFDPEPPLHCYIFKMVYPSWSPDGQYIAYLRGGEDPDDIGGLFIFDLVNQTEHLVITGASNKSSQAWSPDGEWLTFSMGAQIYKIRTDGYELTRLTSNDNRAYFDPAWSPDGNWIAYSDRSAQSLGNTGGWVMQPDGTSARWLTKYVTNQSWSMDGNLFISRNRLIETNDNNEWVYEIVLIDGEDGSDTSTIWIDPKRIITTLDYSITNYKLVFQSVHRYEGDTEVWKINADGSGLKRLTFNGGAFPAWSPDGSTIAYVNIDYFEGGGHIWLMDADGSNRRPMVED